MSELSMLTFLKRKSPKPNLRYILKGKKAVPCTNLQKWAESFEKNYQVAFDKSGNIKVSTIFLGMNHNYGRGKPLLFETMIFGGKHNNYQERYSTWEEAEEGHKKACFLAFKRKGMLAMLHNLLEKM